MKSSTGAVARSTITVEIDHRLCKGCGLCVAFCRERGITLSALPNSRGVHAAQTARGVVCCACRACVLMCPEAAIRILRA